MKLLVNGTIQNLPAPARLAELLDRLGLPSKGVLVERNGAPVDRNVFSQTELIEGDKIEVIQMVAGG
jgi:sulfur carrier protein